MIGRKKRFDWVFCCDFVMVLNLSRLLIENVCNVVNFVKISAEMVENNRFVAAGMLQKGLTSLLLLVIVILC